MMQIDYAGSNRLRFIFDDAVISFNLLGGATFGDIALMLGELAPRHGGRPLMIDVKLDRGNPS